MNMFKIHVVTPPRKHARKSFVQRYVVLAPSASEALALFMAESNTMPGDEVLVFACDGAIVYRDSYMETPGNVDRLRADASNGLKLSHKVSQ